MCSLCHSSNPPVPVSAPSSLVFFFLSHSVLFLSLLFFFVFFFPTMASFSSSVPSSPARSPFPGRKDMSEAEKENERSARSRMRQVRQRTTHAHLKNRPINYTMAMLRLMRKAGINMSPRALVLFARLAKQQEATLSPTLHKLRVHGKHVQVNENLLEQAFAIIDPLCSPEDRRDRRIFQRQQLTAYLKSKGRDLAREEEEKKTKKAKRAEERKGKKKQEEELTGMDTSDRE